MLPWVRHFGVRFVVALIVVSLACLLGVNPRAQAIPGDPAGGAISGTVVNQITGTPLKGALVEAINKGVVRAVLTDSKGRFVLVDLGPADYLLNVTKAGFKNGHYSPALMGSAGGVVAVNEGGWEKDIEIRLQPLAAMSGRVTDGLRQPLVGVPVRALRAVDIDGRSVWVPSRTGTTDDRGEYRLAELEPGTYTIVVLSTQHSSATQDFQVEAAGQSELSLSWSPVRPGVSVLLPRSPSLRPASDGRLWVLPTTYAPGVPSVEHAIPYTIEADDEEIQGIDIVVEPRPAYVVSGRLGGDAASLVGHIARLMPEHLEYLGAGHEAASTRIRSDGTFVMVGVPAGSYLLRIPGDFTELVSVSTGTHPADTGDAVPLTPAHPRSREIASGALVALAPSLTLRQYSPSFNGPPVLVRQPVLVVDRDVVIAPQTIAFGSVAGEIVYEGVAGGVASGTVHLTPADAASPLAAYSSWVSARTTAALSRSFDMPAVQPGMYVPRLQAMAPLAIKSVEVSGATSRSDLVPVGAGGRTEVRIIVVQEARVSGSIRAASGDLAKGSSAIIFPSDRDLWGTFGFTPSRIRLSTGRSDGRYELTGIRPGDYFLAAVSASDAEHWMDARVLERLAASGMRVSFAQGDVRQVDLVLRGRQ